jgi:ribonuclease G
LVNELFLERSSGVTRIALTSDKQLVEYHKESGHEAFQVGDLYLGKVKRVVPGLNAAFIDVGHERDAFLHFHDLGPHYSTLYKHTRRAIEAGVKNGSIDNVTFEDEVLKTGSIDQHVKRGQLLMVQVAKEPIHNKGPRVTCDISFAGRYLVLIPFSQQLSVSKKIGSPEKKREIKEVVKSIKPGNFGIIVRTVAENASIDEIKDDLISLTKRWEKALKSLKGANHRVKLVAEGSTVEILLRDIINESFENIWVSDPKLSEEIRLILKKIAPEKEGIVRIHKGKTPLFDHFDIEKQIKTSFGKKVPFSAGSYLIIEHTEALHVIDVNSGRQLNSGDNQQEIALQVNLEAAKEIGRQLRLRDMGGIIVVDFIDLKSPNYKKQLDQKLREYMQEDKARHTILPMSKFGLIQITRERLRPETVISTTELCPACNGSGKIESASLLSDRIDESLAFLWMNQNMKRLTLRVNPILKSFFTKGLLSYRNKWFLKYGKWLRIKDDYQMPLGVFTFENESGEEIIL